MIASTWTNRVWQERHARRLTFAQKDVLLTLAGYRVRGGSIQPSHETIAERVGCCVRTVQRALEAAREIGLVSWCERRVRRGWRALRASNRYALTVPAEPRPATTGLKVRAIFKRKIHPVPSITVVPPVDRAEALAALARRRAVVEARLLGRG